MIGITAGLIMLACAIMFIILMLIGKAVEVNPND